MIKRKKVTILSLQQPTVIEMDSAEYSMIIPKILD